MADSTPAISGQESPKDKLPTSLTLLEKLRTNETDAWLRLKILYRPYVIFWCRRFGVSRDNIDDIWQDVSRVVFQKVGEFRHDRRGDSFRGWLRGITRNLIQAHFRQLGHARAEGGTDAAQRLHDIPDPLIRSDEEDPEQEVAALLHRALKLIGDEFSERDWQVFQLTFIEGLDSSAAAAQLGMSPAAVRKAKSRMRRRLNEELGEV